MPGFLMRGVYFGMGLIDRIRSALSLAHTETPEPGEQTGQQGRLGMRGASFHAADRDYGFDPPPPASIATYRRMRSNPTLAMARAAATAPIKAADWSIDLLDGAPAEAEALIEETILPQRSDIMRELMSALDYGFRAFEKVWEHEDGNLILKRLKALSPERSELLIDVHGNLIGVRQGQSAPVGTVTVSIDGVTPTSVASPLGLVFLPLNKCFVFSYDAEDGNWYGRARHENVREAAWWPWMQTVQRLGVYVRKTSGVMPVVKFPVGDEPDESGNAIPNDEIAARVIENLRAGHGVSMPQNLLKWAEDLITQGADPSALMAWQISFLEPRAGHGREYESMMRHFESLMVRGWLVPERAILEGQFGTKAESGQHADFALLMAEELLDQVIRVFNQQVIDPLLVFNYGPAAAGTVRIKPAPIQDSDRAFFRQIITSLLTDQSNLDLFSTLVDLEQILDRTDTPMREGIDPQQSIADLLAERRKRSPSFSPPSDDDDDDDDDPQPNPRLNGAPNPSSRV